MGRRAKKSIQDCEAGPEGDPDCRLNRFVIRAGTLTATGCKPCHPKCPLGGEASIRGGRVESKASHPGCPSGSIASYPCSIGILGEMSSRTRFGCMFLMQKVCVMVPTCLYLEEGMLGFHCRQSGSIAGKGLELAE